MTERNNALLARLDERDQSILRELRSINEEQKATNEHLAKLNGKTEKTAIFCGKNRTHINIQWYVISAIMVGCALKFLGIY